jgi:hypothetical protein
MTDADRVEFANEVSAPALLSTPIDTLFFPIWFRSDILRVTTTQALFRKH